MTAIGEAERTPRYRRAAAVWVVVVVGASVVDPAVVLGSTAGGSGSPLAAVGIDAFVVAHLVAYGVLGWLLVGVVDPGAGVRRAVIAAAVVATAVGVGVELLQAPLAARTASTADALVNAIGAVVGAGVGGLGRRR
jgi:VanZ family protein